MTVRFKNELVRNITIKLGYANAKVRSPRLPKWTHISSTHCPRSTSVKMRHAHDQAATGHTDRTKKTTHPVNDRDAVTA